MDLVERQFSKRNSLYFTHTQSAPRRFRPQIYTDERGSAYCLLPDAYCLRSTTYCLYSFAHELVILQLRLLASMRSEHLGTGMVDRNQQTSIPIVNFPDRFLQNQFMTPDSF